MVPFSIQGLPQIILSSGSMPAYGHSTAEPPAPQCAFLDDLNVLQAAYFDDAAAAGVAEVIRRLAAGGLRVRPDKSLAIAMRGTVFDEAARHACVPLTYRLWMPPCQSPVRALHRSGYRWGTQPMCMLP